MKCVKGEDGLDDTELLFRFSEKCYKMMELGKSWARTEVVGTCCIDIGTTTEGVRAGCQDHRALCLQERDC